MRGMQRVPALLFNTPLASMADLGLDKYEILPAEPLHDIGHHIENIFTELPKHLSDEESKFLEESIEICLGNKDSKRTVDYRTALVKITGCAHQYGRMSHQALAILDSLVEIQRILYLPEEERCPAIILRYYNQVWCHCIFLKEIVTLPKKLTLRKLYGVYFHNLSAHAGLMLRIISGQASHTEDQERIFNHLKRITKSTSNYHPGQIIPNMLIRLQAEKELGNSEDHVSSQQSQITKLAQCLPPLRNTCIPLDMIRKHSREWQAHLQQIGDFLMEGKDKWWSKDDEAIEFHDVSNYPPAQTTGPSLHHFRSSTLTSEVAYLKQSWERCIKERIPIPTHILRLDQADGTTVIHTRFLDTGNPDEVIDEQDQLLDNQLSDNPSLHVNAQPVEADHENFDYQEGDFENEVINIAPVLDEVNNLQRSDSTSSNNPIPQFVEDHESSCNEEDSYEDEVISIAPASDEIITLREPSASTNNPLPSSNIKSCHEEKDPDSNTDVQQVDNVSSKHPTTENTNSQGIVVQSRLGKALEEVLGKTGEVVQFDKKHLELKQMQQSSIHTYKRKQLESAYKDILAQLQTKVLAESSNAKQGLMNWEKQYFITNNFSTPSYEAMKADKTAYTFLKKIKYAKALLKEWKIDFA